MTYLITGLYRGGTTMTAECVERAGVYLYYDIDETKEPSLLQTNDIEAIKREASKHSVWAYKYPGLKDRWRDIAEALHDPRFIVVMRDIKAVVDGEMRGAFTGNVRTEEQLYDFVYEQYERLIEVAKQKDYPVFVFSYEKAIVDPFGFASDLVSFLGRGSVDDIVNGIEPGKHGKS